MSGCSVCRKVLSGCSRVVAASTGTNSDAIASSVTRILECVADPGVCVLLLTTEGSLSEARGARKVIEATSRAVAGDRVFIDSDDCGFHAYAGLFVNPREAAERLKCVGEAVGEKLSVIDITCGTKLQSFLALNLLQSVNEDESVIAYVPGQGFASRGLLRSWWSGLGYPRTPRSLQPVLTAIGSLGGCCNPHVIEPPQVYDAVDEAPSGLSGLIGFATWLLNSATCSKAKLVVKVGGSEAEVATIDWSEPALERILGAVVSESPPERGGAISVFDSWLSLVCKALGENAWRGSKGKRSIAGDAYRCLSAAAKMATSELVVKEAHIEGEDPRDLKGRPLADLLLDEDWGPRLLGRLLPDTNAVYYGLINTLYLFATMAWISGKKNIIEKQLRDGALIAAHDCVLGELRRHGVESIKHTVLQPCRARGLLALYAANALEKASNKVIPGSGKHCDLDLVEAAEKRRLILLTGDTGMLMYARMRNIDYIRVEGSQRRAIGHSGELWHRHLAAAAAAQLLAVLALTAEPLQPLYIKGDSRTLTVGSTIENEKQQGRERLVIKVEALNRA